MKEEKTGNQYKDSINLPKTDFPMKAGLPQLEPKILAKWQNLDVYHSLQKQRANADTFVLHDGPPYANGDIHTGHAMQKILKDMIIKSKNLAGYRSPYVPGWDCHGLPIEIQVEKKHGKAGHKIDKKTFRQKCRDYAQRQVEGQKKDFIRLGIQGDWENPYLTMAFKTEADIVRSLARIIDAGHVYHGLMPVYWCPACGSALAEAEVEYQDRTSPAIDVLFAISEKSDFAARIDVDPNQLEQPALVIWTTTPWTLPANEAVSLNPELDYVLVNADGQQWVLANELLDDALTRYGFNNAPEKIACFKGSALEHLLVKHPFYDKTVPVILGDHVTTEVGTGAVHTAPAHGVEDFAVGKQYQLPVNNPVGANGTFIDSTDIFAGQFVFKANVNVINVLKEKNRLLQHEDYEHSYPHCWRHKTPILYRATAQWFIGMTVLSGKQALRQRALQAISQVRWEPVWGQARIESMIENRPDWCISRQRNWGVPIPIFLHKETAQMHPDSSTLMERVALLIEQQGIQAWFDLDKQQLLGDEAEDYDKVDDTLDVWFDSGVTHNSVVKAREELEFPADLYLEGSDQHRGWFQSSLLSSVAMNAGAPPYKMVLTHGFTVDQQGRKMSKSLGNVIAPQTVFNSLGADVLRLWVAATDYKSEMSLSEEILKRTSDAYRRIRNTARYLLGNLHGFDDQHRLAWDDMLELDQWAVRTAKTMQADAVRAYDGFLFHSIYQRLHQFCVVEMGGFYLDIIKDRLYTLPENSVPRRSAQTAMSHILESLVRLLTPILSFTAEEIWGYMNGEREASVLYAEYYQGLNDIADDPLADRKWQSIIQVRNEVAKQIELLRIEGGIGAALDAQVTLYAEDELYETLASIGAEMRFVLISSGYQLLADSEAGETAQQTDIEGLYVAVSPLEYDKCVRCWHKTPDVGNISRHPELCQRCVDNIEGGGEQRFFA